MSSSKRILLDHGLYLGQWQISWDSSQKDTPEQGIHSVLFDENQDQAPFNRFKEAMSILSESKYLKTKGPALHHLSQGWDYVELVFDASSAEAFWKSLPLLKQSGDFVLYPLTEKNIVNFEKNIQKIKTLQPEIVLVLQPEDKLLNLFEYQQLAQRYLSVVRVIPKVPFQNS